MRIIIIAATAAIIMISRDGRANQSVAVVVDVVVVAAVDSKPD